MRTLSHPNIVAFYGSGTTTVAAVARAKGEHSGENSSAVPFCLLELVPQGSLQALLTRGIGAFPWEQRLGFACDIAKGMVYLHGRKPPIGHRDLKPSSPPPAHAAAASQPSSRRANVLVTETGVCKITDFGTVLRPKRRDRSRTQWDPLERVSSLGSRFETGVEGTEPYMAPEVLNAKCAPRSPSLPLAHAHARGVQSGKRTTGSAVMCTRSQWFFTNSPLGCGTCASALVQVRSGSLRAPQGPTPCGTRLKGWVLQTR